MLGCEAELRIELAKEANTSRLMAASFSAVDRPSSPSPTDLL